MRFIPEMQGTWPRLLHQEVAEHGLQSDVLASILCFLPPLCVVSIVPVAVLGT